MRCPSCQADFPILDGPTHPYMLSSPGCWAAYGELLAREYGAYRRMPMHRLTVDTYAVQHPGVDMPAARRSVAVHLCRLCLLLERSWPMERANAAMLTISANKDSCAWLEPRSMHGTLNVADVLATRSDQEHEQQVRAWAGSVWDAWAVHHPAVRAWCARLGQFPGQTGPRSV